MDHPLNERLDGQSTVNFRIFYGYRRVYLIFIGEMEIQHEFDTIIEHGPSSSHGGDGTTQPSTIHREVCEAQNRDQRGDLSYSVTHGLYVDNRITGAYGGLPLDRNWSSEESFVNTDGKAWAWLERRTLYLILILTLTLAGTLGEAWSWLERLAKLAPLGYKVT